jgi:hypothetical protein
MITKIPLSVNTWLILMHGAAQETTAQPLSRSRKAWQLVFPGKIECLLDYIFISYIAGISYFRILSS